MTDQNNNKRKTKNKLNSISFISDDGHIIYSSTSSNGSFQQTKVIKKNGVTTVNNFNNNKPPANTGGGGFSMNLKNVNIGSGNGYEPNNFSYSNLTANNGSIIGDNNTKITTNSFSRSKPSLIYNSIIGNNNVTIRQQSFCKSNDNIISTSIDGNNNICVVGPNVKYAATSVSDEGQNCVIIDGIEILDTDEGEEIVVSDQGVIIDQIKKKHKQDE